MAWTTAGYDDSSWINAKAPYPNGVTTPQDIVAGSSAEFMWFRDPSNPVTNGTDGPVTAYFRYDFVLDSSADLPVFGQAKVIADDVFEIYVNGVFVKTGILSENLASSGQIIPLFIDFTLDLNFGNNVIAIKARDGESGPPHDQVYELLFFDGKVASAPVPEPATIILLGFRSCKSGSVPQKALISLH